jgi:hypothetical protein
MNGNSNKSPMTQVFENSSRVDLKQEIIGYLYVHPEAADTVDGILDWWLPLQRYENTKNEIQLALHELVEQGLIEEVVLGNGNRLYRLHSAKDKQL